MELSDDSEDDYFFAGEEVDIEAYYGHAATMASTYGGTESASDVYVDFEHRFRDDNEPVFMPSYPDWMKQTSYAEIECDAEHDVDSLHHVMMANLRANLPIDYNLDDDEGFIEYFYEGDAYKLCRLFDDEPPMEVGPDEELCVRVYFNGPKVKEVRKQVVKRDDALVTKEELQVHEKEVQAAIQKELDTWVKHECISRRPRAVAKNIIDVRWVYKWKLDAETRGVESSDAAASV